MRPNNNVLLENVNDYLQHVGVLPNQIDKVQHSLKKEMKKTDKKDMDYAESRQKSHAEILQIIERNIVIVNYNPIIFYTLNFLLMAYLFDKKLIPFSAVTGLYILYFVFILFISSVIYMVIKKNSYLYPNQSLMTINILLFSIGVILCILKIFNVNLGIFVVPLILFQILFGIGIILVLISPFIKKPEVAAMGLAVMQKTIASVTSNELFISILTVSSWFIIIVIILYFVMIYSTRKYV
ncbi:hypothetical protein [Mammaliicoccus sp. Dog046]|uniref:hypothetical protein n=1 Tax=Mammaliicoccus sp. Dog046 TaxID=3034233 RepID=UPI002B25B680|nr:hypothetical protein [Mammaliicoccus sp. Dog046]WQK85240.1 hypothetical protein P3U32_11500 [Mammaliicoccus sp. Dog046]